LNSFDHFLAYLLIFEMPDEISADFTAATGTDLAVECSRGVKCAKRFYPPGTNLHYLHSNDPNEPGHAVCDNCRNYYLGKATTKWHSVSALMPTAKSK
jgi:hypothetical protein